MLRLILYASRAARRTLGGGNRTAFVMVGLALLLPARPGLPEPPPQRPGVSADQPPAPEQAPDPGREKRLAWFREAKFGLFIHFGIYAVPAGRWQGVDYPFIGEWIMRWAKIPAAQYAGLAKQFNPRKFDAEAIAQLAQDAGMKYVVITAKHHDGFAMYDSKVTPYDIVDATPYRRDPLRALGRAVARRGLKYGFYYSQAQDWHEANAAGNTWDFPTPHEQRKPDEYLARKAMPQVKELLRQYGPLGLIWFDTPTLLSKEQVLALEALVRQQQPGTLVNSRLGHGLGDYRQMGDNMVPSDVYPSDWEVPATLNDTWGWKSADRHWKSAGYLIYRLVDVVSKGGNYLLNIGPAADGSIPPESAERLREVGRWVARHGEAIYGAGHSPYSVEGQPWRITTRPGTLYVHLLRWPAGGRFRLPGLKNPVKSAFLLSDPERRPLKLAREGEALVVHLPFDLPDPHVAVLALTIDGAPDVDASLRWDAVRPRITLAAGDSSPHGPHVRFSERDGTVSGFVEPRDKLQWHLLIKQPGRYRAELEYAADLADAGGQVELTAQGQRLRAAVHDTGAEFRWIALGTLEAKRASLEEARLAVPTSGKSSGMRVRTVRLSLVL
jgi:alpha-L-fucosidase